MVVLLLLLALGMIGIGVAAMVFGLPIIQVERGWAMVIAGSVSASSGAVLVGIALAAQRLGRIAHETVRMRDRLSHLTEILEEGSPPSPAGPPPPSVGSPATPPEALGPMTVVGQYNSGGNAYTMFSDGSILADTPQGQRRFSSIDELRSTIGRD